MLSVLDLFRVGLGPSSSHTVGPMRIAKRFLREARKSGELAHANRVEVELQGSLALTGVGHGTDKAVILGLLGFDPETAEPDEAEDTSFGGLLKWVVAAAALAFLAGVFLRYQPALFNGGERAERSEEATDPETGDTEAAGDTVPPEGETGEALFPPDIDPVEAGKNALERAEEAIAANRYGEARAWLTQVPPELQNNNYQSLLQEANSEVAEAAARNQDILNNARQIIQPASASMFNDAIEQARQVPPEDPFYEQAQADIARWGQVILDLAEGRAASGDINGAIAAARLVPTDQPQVATAAAQLSLRLLASFAHAHVYADAPRVGRPTTYDGEAGAEMVEYKKG